MKRGLSDIQLEDDEIIVSLPGTNYAVTYYKPPKHGTSRMIKLANCAGFRIDPATGADLS
jgi:hypothetical protein